MCVRGQHNGENKERRGKRKHMDKSRHHESQVKLKHGQVHEHKLREY